MPINTQIALDLWARLGSEGKAPTELIFAANALPAYTVAIDPWVDRLAKTYLQNLSRRNAHFKLVLAPYGGGKTHFLMSLGSRALAEGFAVAYLACAEAVSFDSPLDVYRFFMKTLQLPGEDRPGTTRFLQAVLRQQGRNIEAANPPDPHAALEAWLHGLAREEFPELSFGRVMAEALREQALPESSQAGEAALRWLQGDITSLTAKELRCLRLAKPPVRAHREIGYNLLVSVIPFLKEAGALGAVVLFDEVETLLSQKGKALDRVLSAMRVMVDMPTGVPGGVPLLGVYAANEEVLEPMGRYQALQQRLAVVGASFEEGNDLAPQLPLERVSQPKQFLQSLGTRLLDLAGAALGFAFDRPLQLRNIELLAQVANQSSLAIDSRRLFIKACVNILDQEARQGEREYPEEELRKRYMGFFHSLRQDEQGESEP